MTLMTNHRIVRQINKCSLINPLFEKTNLNNSFKPKQSKYKQLCDLFFTVTLNYYLTVASNLKCKKKSIEIYV